MTGYEIGAEWRHRFLAETRLGFVGSVGRRVTRPSADHHVRMADHWVDRAHALGRPDYWEAAGFTADQWQLDGGKPFGSSVCGREQPYGPFSRAFWKCVRLAMRSAFLAEWHRALGTTYETVEGARGTVVITGLT